MRLSAEQRQSIKDTVAKVLGDSASVLLFGSRLDDDKRGGDVGLLIKCQ